MGYILGQYNFKEDSTSDLNSFMDYVNEGSVYQKQTASTTAGSLVFTNDGVDGTFNPNMNYYFHGRIKKLTSPQTIYVKLVNKVDDGKEQFLKVINIDGGTSSEWQDVEIIFTPFVSFDVLLFELQRTPEDYTSGNPRKPIICFQELSIVNNIIGNSNISKAPKAGAEFIKIGVQSRPGFTMCINGEEIHTSRSGIYELKSGVVLVSFFSVVGAGKVPGGQTYIKDYEDSTKELIDNHTPWEQIPSVCFFNTGTYPKERAISSFTLDYVYKDE